MMAMKTYRDRARDLYNITEPEVILSITAHVAFEKGISPFEEYLLYINLSIYLPPTYLYSSRYLYYIYKAAHYFGIKTVYVPFDKDYKPDLQLMKKAINKNTILLVASGNSSLSILLSDYLSIYLTIFFVHLINQTNNQNDLIYSYTTNDLLAPQYPHGIVEPVEEIAAIALEHNLPFHVDACVGTISISIPIYIYNYYLYFYIYLYLFVNSSHSLPIRNIYSQSKADLYFHG